MKLSEIITLSRAGFKAAEIRKMMIDEEADEQQTDPEPETDEAGAADPDDQTEDSTNDEGSAADQDPAEPEPDYKKLYLEEKAKREKAQQKNIRTEQPDKPDDNDIILNLVNEFL